MTHLPGRWNLDQSPRGDPVIDEPISGIDPAGSSPSLVHIRDVLERIARLSGVELRYRFVHNSIEESFKDDGSPVTDADVFSQRTIIRELGLSFPDVFVMAEEEGWDRGPRSSSEDFLVVDPIDGTANFADGLPMFYVSIAYVSTGQPVVGILHNPISGELFSAVAGQGAFLNGVPTHTSEFKPLELSSVHVNVRRLGELEADKIIHRVAQRSRKVRSLGSVTADLSMVIRGKSDAVIGHHLASWDIAAVALILEQAGGIVTCIDGSPIEFDKTTKFSICGAGNRRFHSQLMRLVNSS